MNRYPAEQIYYEMDFLACPGNEMCSSLVAEVLSKAPRRVVDKVLKHCAIVMPNSDGAYFNSKYAKDSLIVLSERLLDMKSKEQHFTVLHEVAHFHLKHKDSMLSSMTKKQQKRQEDKADELANKWNRNRVKRQGKWL